MKWNWLLLILLLPIATSVAPAQANPSIPLYYTIHGGLFFPSYQSFRGTYQSSSDLVWGVGIGLPVSANYFYLIGDLAWFKADGYFDVAQDSAAHLEQRFIHVGLLQKAFVAPALAIRLQAGLTQTSAAQTSSSPRSESVKVEIPSKIAYMGGVGIEEMLGNGSASVHADLIYEYRRSRATELLGDFGGVRVEFGLNIYLF